jgi:lysozyme family protein
MADFSEADHVTEQNEGGLANNSKDPGKLTYAGVSQRYWPNWKGWPYVLAAMSAHNQGATAEDVREINAELRANPAVTALLNGFYMANFWNVNQLSALSDQEIADNLYDCGVNQGTGEAAHILQNAINDVLGAGTVASDGGIGPKTLAAAARCDQVRLYAAINDERLSSYKRDSDWPVFKSSWVARLKPYGAL